MVIECHDRVEGTELGDWISELGWNLTSVSKVVVIFLNSLRPLYIILKAATLRIGSEGEWV